MKASTRVADQDGGLFALMFAEKRVSAKWVPGCSLSRKLNETSNTTVAAEVVRLLRNRQNTNRNVSNPV